MIKKKKILNPETGRMVNLTGKIGQKVLSQRAGGVEMPDEKKDPEGYKEWLENEKKKEARAKLPLAMRRMRQQKQAQRKNKTNKIPKKQRK